MIRPKKVDIDKPRGYIKIKLRRWFRRFLKKETVREIARTGTLPTALLICLVFVQSGDLPTGTIRCDYDGQLMPLKGSILMRDNHLICDLHVRFDQRGRAICPIDGSIGGR